MLNYNKSLTHKLYQAQQISPCAQLQGAAIWRICSENFMTIRASLVKEHSRLLSSTPRAFSIVL